MAPLSKQKCLMVSVRQNRLYDMIASLRCYSKLFQSLGPAAAKSPLSSVVQYIYWGAVAPKKPKLCQMSLTFDPESCWRAYGGLSGLSSASPQHKFLPSSPETVPGYACGIHTFH